MEPAPPRLARDRPVGLAGGAGDARRPSAAIGSRCGSLLDAQGAIDALAHRRDQLERDIAALLPSSPWAVQAGKLRCLRGIDTLTAVGLCAEIGDSNASPAPSS